jgi:GMP synthase (glutamine-hydrolysing)
MSSASVNVPSDAVSDQLHIARKQVAILDFGSQYSHIIARRVRELNVFCELYSCLVDAAALEVNHVVGIIFSGGPSSVYAPDSPHVHRSVWELIEKNNIPVLGICYGMQEIAFHFGGEVQPSLDREYGRSTIDMTEENKNAAELIFQGVHHSQMWMSHGDKVTRMPPGFVKIAHTANSEHAAIADPVRKIFGLQFHPEVTHSIAGKEILRNFTHHVCNAPTDWNMKDIAEEFIKEVCICCSVFCFCYCRRVWLTPSRNLAQLSISP